MKKKTIVLIFILILVPLAVYLLCPSDEARIKKLIKQGVSAIEKKEIDNIMSKISFAYRDDYGMTYLYIKKILEKQFMSMSDIQIEYENLKIDVKDNSAFAELDVRVIATTNNQTGYIIGDIESPVHIKFTLDKERAKWLVVKTEGLRY